jgi:hypothetical protein
MHPTARIGFHAPSLSVPKGRYNAAVVNEAYIKALNSIAILQREMQMLHIPISLVTTMLETPPQTFTEITTVSEATRLGISVAPVPMPQELTLMTANLACSHAQSQTLDQPFSYLDNISGLEPGPDGLRLQALELSGYGNDGLSFCDLWLWPAGEGSYQRRPTSIAGRISLSNLLTPVMFWPPEMLLTDLALKDDATIEVAHAQKVTQTSKMHGLCLRMDSVPVLLEQAPCTRKNRAD